MQTCYAAKMALRFQKLTASFTYTIASVVTTQHHCHGATLSTYEILSYNLSLSLSLSPLSLSKLCEQQGGAEFSVVRWIVTSCRVVSSRSRFSTAAVWFSVSVLVVSGLYPSVESGVSRHCDCVTYRTAARGNVT